MRQRPVGNEGLSVISGKKHTSRQVGELVGLTGNGRDRCSDGLSEHCR